jgi:hypothetical protein
VQRRLVFGPAQPHARADDQREDTHACESDVERTRTVGNRLNGYRDNLGATGPKNAVFERLPAAGTV